MRDAVISRIGAAHEALTDLLVSYEQSHQESEELDEQTTEIVNGAADKIFQSVDLLHKVLG